MQNQIYRRNCGLCRAPCCYLWKQESLAIAKTTARCAIYIAAL